MHATSKPQRLRSKSKAGQPPSPSQGGARNWFFVGMSGGFLLIVLIAFGPSAVARTCSAGRPMPIYLHLHGAIFSAWFALLFLQTNLVALRRTSVHRLLGIAGAGLVMAVVGSGLWVTLWAVHRRRSIGVDIDAHLERLSSIVWTDFGSLLTFSVLVLAAIALRHRRESHGRLLLIASLSILGPALPRIQKWTALASFSPDVVSLAGLGLLLVAIGVYDLHSAKRLHPATALGGVLFLGVRLSAIVIAGAEFGQAFVRGLG